MGNRRKYELKERALRQKQTRERIIQTVVALHEELGPARTTVVEIAQRAGVSRPTVYDHFPDEGSLIRACAGYWLAANVPPDPAVWAGIADPKQRLRVALRQLYDYYRSRARMLTHVLRDAAFIPSLSEAVEGSLGNYRETAVEAVASATGKVGGHRRRTLAALKLALDFHTWQTLTGNGALSDREAVELMAVLVETNQARPARGRPAEPNTIT